MELADLRVCVCSRCVESMMITVSAPPTEGLRYVARARAHMSSDATFVTYLHGSRDAS